ncbi:conjugal transfer protein [Streptomyces sp. MI02-7b]|uniref:conjugal transfer protein n=1 Tax=Streptomyces sp. MI02-7b TaxID=462941 RepID=UPI0029BE8211|nr:conjugal transfer protein [Streptomyces sp. MI02-7b]MDX3075904.1 conjugal transfer protein [Streptomyces sp. MI02-7b]
MSLARIGVWAALAAGPLALLANCATPRTSTAVAQPKAPAAAAVRIADPAGVAALFTDLWLRSGSTDDQSGTAQAVRALAPTVALPQRSGKPAGQALQRTVAVRSVELGRDTWSVVVAAQFASSGAQGASTTPTARLSSVRYFAVPVLSSNHSDGAGAFTVTAPPAEVAGPASAPVPESGLSRPLPSSGPVARSLQEFFAAYLTGVGEVDRYLSPGTALAAVRGTGYRSVGVDQVDADSDIADGAVPRDGRRVTVRAQVTATDPAGDQWPLSYVLSLTARDGRWEVTALEAGAPPETTRVPTASSAGVTATGGEGR